MNDRAYIQRGRLWKPGARLDVGAGEKGLATPELAQQVRGGIINAHLDGMNLALTGSPAFVGYVGTPTTTGTSTTPKVTYSTTAMSKSYSPAGMLGKN